jgi:hypothetical protein
MQHQRGGQTADATADDDRLHVVSVNPRRRRRKVRNFSISSLF